MSSKSSAHNIQPVHMHERERTPLGTQACTRSRSGLNQAQDLARLPDAIQYYFATRIRSNTDSVKLSIESQDWTVGKRLISIRKNS